jgi:SAM-dependent methyltransferase
VSSVSTGYQKLVEDEWLNAATIRAWTRWHDKVTVETAAVTKRLAMHAQIHSGARVLDLASGTGDPAIALARLVGPGGHVTATDLSEGMLDAARENARKAGQANLSFRHADAQALPFDDESFDAVTCRLGIMYFVDVHRALREVRRVLKPRGRVALAAWGPWDRGTFWRFVLGPLFARRPPSPPPPDAPSPLRFAASSSLSAALGEAGFTSIEEENSVVPTPWPGPAEEVWAQFYDLAVPLRPYIDSFSPETRGEAFRESLAMLPDGGDPECTELTAAVNFASARK